MRVREMFEIKYKEYMKNITHKAWENHKYYAELQNIPVYQQIMMCMYITENDLKRWGTFYGGELKELHKGKYIASNMHRQEHGHIDRWWLTKKGYKKLFG